MAGLNFRNNLGSWRPISSPASKFPWLNDNYVREIEERTKNAPIEYKKLLEQKMYSDLYSQQKKEEEQNERLSLKNEIFAKSFNAKWDEKASYELWVKKGNLADVIRNYYWMSLSDWDDETVIQEFTGKIKDWDKMYIDYLNWKNSDIIVKTWLLGNKWQQLAEKNTIWMTSNADTKVVQNLKKQTQPSNLISTSHFDDDAYAANYISKQGKEYDQFIQAAKENWYTDWQIASVIDAGKTYENFQNRWLWEKIWVWWELPVGIAKWFTDFFVNAYNNLIWDNANIWALWHLDSPMQDLSKWFWGWKYWNLRAWSNYVWVWEWVWDLMANTAVMMLLPWVWFEAWTEWLVEWAVNQWTKWVVKNIGTKMFQWAVEWAEFGALATVWQENANLDKLETNMWMWALFWSVFWLWGAWVEWYKYRNILKTVLKEWDKEWTVKGMVELFNKAVRPSSQWVNSSKQVMQYNEDAIGAVESIIKNKNNLKFVTADWEEIVWQLPKNMEEFWQALTQTKSSVYNEYNKIAQEAWVTTNVSTENITSELKKLLKDKEWRVWKDNATISKIEKWISDLDELWNSLSVEWTQSKIQELNQKLQAFLKNPNPNDVTANAVDGLVLNGLKRSIDDAIENAWLDSQKYVQLRNIYRQIKTIEKDVNHRAVVDARKNPQWLLDTMSDLQTIDAIADIFQNPIWWTVKLIKTKWLKKIIGDKNDPNKMIEKLFSKAEWEISKSNTLKTSRQLDKEAIQSRNMGLRRSRQERLQEREAQYNRKQEALKALREKQQADEQAYQDWLKSQWVWSETKALPQQEWVQNYNTIIQNDSKPIIADNQWNSMMEWMIWEFDKPIKQEWFDKWLKFIEKDSDFWPSFEGLKWNDAIQFLKENKAWQVKWAYEYNWEPIDLIRWQTNAATNWRWYWLSKIEEKHQWMLERIDDIISNTKWYEDDNWILYFDNWKERVVVIPQYKWKEKRWIISAYKKTSDFKIK